MLYVYRKALSDGAAELAEKLNGRRWRDKQTPLATKARAGDVVICWGQAFAKEAVRVLNGGALRSKFDDVTRLREAGVPTIDARRTRPTETRQVPAGPDPAVTLWNAASELAEDFVEDEVGETVPRSGPRIRGIDELITSLTGLRAALNTPIPTARTEAVPATGEWVGRASDHVGGTDLLSGTGTDFFVKKETFTNEYRVHSFAGVSIRAGKKVPRDGFTAGRNLHPWVRSWDGGWRILYDGVSVKQRHRDVARQAVEALGLDFGAVDIGERADGTLCVLEVNRAPGLEGGTIDRYVSAITKWIEGTPRAARRAA